MSNISISEKIEAVPLRGKAAPRVTKKERERSMVLIAVPGGEGDCLMAGCITRAVQSLEKLLPEALAMKALGNPRTHACAWGVLWVRIRRVQLTRKPWRIPS